MTKLKPKGKFVVQHIRDGIILGEYDFPNAAVDVGKDAMLDIMFDGDTQIVTWYLGLIDAAGFSAEAAADTMASHAGWAEAVIYSEGSRVPWVSDPASGQVITNSAPSVFTMNNVGTIKGFFLTSDSVKGGVIGTLWATGLFNADRAVLAADVLNVTYSVSL